MQKQKADERKWYQRTKPLDVEVVSISGTRVELTDGDSFGELCYSDVPRAALVRCLTPRTVLRARPIRRIADGRWEFSTQGLLPKPWAIAAERLNVGDVVHGRVQATRDFGAFIEVLPQVVGLAHISELDWSFVDADNLADFTSPGQVVQVKVMELDFEKKKLELSLKRAFGTHPEPLPSLVPDGVPFTWPRGEGLGSVMESREPFEQQVESLTNVRDAAAAEGKHLAKVNKQFREQVQTLKKQLRSAEDRFTSLERKLAPELDPVGSERGFLLGVRLAYSRLFDEGARQVKPLRKMRVGSAFLESLRNIGGIGVQKVLNVCAQVAAAAAHGRVHPLYDGSPGAEQRVRSSDGAKAWRCCLQERTPSARRLHFWLSPGKDGDGPTIELWHVGIHDDYPA